MNGRIDNMENSIRQFLLQGIIHLDCFSRCSIGMKTSGWLGV